MAPREIGPLGAPPPALSTLELPVMRHGAALARIHGVANDPTFFGTTGDNRFDAAHGEFGVMYAAADAHGAFIEVFGDAGNRTVTRSALDARGLASIELARDLAFVDLRAEGLAQIGADARLFAGEHRDAQQWSTALWNHPAAVDGLCYRARHDPGRVSFAIYDRASDAVRAVRRGRLTDRSNLSLVADILETYRFSLIEA